MGNQQKFNLSKSNFGRKGWTLVFYSLIVYSINALLTNSMSVAATYFSKLYGWNQTAILSSHSAAGAVSILLMFVLGRILVNRSPRKFAFVFGMLSVLSIVLFSFVTSFGQLIALYIISQPISAAWCYIINPMLISNWFPRKKGLVIGWATVGIPLGSGFASILYNWAYQIDGIKTAYLPFAVVAAAGLFFLFFIRDNPEECGYAPDNDITMSSERARELLQETKRMAEQSPWTTRRLYTTWQVWFIGIVFGFQLLYVGGVSSQLINRLLEVGYTMNASIHMMLFTSIAACAGSYLCGLLDSKIGPQKAASFVFLLAAAAMITNLVAGGTGLVWLMFISVFLHGVCVGASSNFVVSLCVTLWGRHQFSRAYGAVQPIVQIMGALGSVTAAQTAAHLDLFGLTGYSSTYLLMLLLNLAGFVLLTHFKTGWVKQREEKFAVEDKTGEAPV